MGVEEITGVFKLERFVAKNTAYLRAAVFAAKWRSRNRRSLILINYNKNLMCLCGLVNCPQLRILLWKNCKIRKVNRRTLICELLFPIIFMAMVVALAFQTVSKSLDLMLQRLKWLARSSTSLPPSPSLLSCARSLATSSLKRKPSSEKPSESWECSRARMSAPGSSQNSSCLSW